MKNLYHGSIEDFRKIDITAVFNDRGELLSNEGFNPSDIDYFSRFTKQCIQEMYDEIQDGLVDT